MIGKSNLFSELITSWEEATKAMLDAASPDYDVSRQQLIMAKSKFLSTLSHSLSTRVTGHAKVMPHGTYEENLKLVRWINEEAHHFGLVLRCPITSQPSILHAIPQNPKNPGGGFDVRHKGTGKTSKSRVNFSDLLPLEFMEAPSRREGLSEWHEKIRHQDTKIQK